MRKKLTGFFIVLCMLAAMIPNTVVFAASTFSGGSGTADAPYLISSAADFIQLSTDVNGGTTYEGIYFKQTADVSLSTTGGFVPIGTNSTPFKGTFDGDNKTVTLDINDTNNHSGIFGCVRNATVKNVITAGSVITTGTGGGIAGYSDWGIITNCINGADVTCNGSESKAGGIVGHNTTGIVANCINKGDVTGSVYVGGIIGYDYSSGYIMSCYNEGTVEGKRYVGGICGYEKYTVKYCVNNGAVNATSSFVGGVVGYFAYNKQYYDKCYYNSTVNSDISEVGNLEITGGAVSGDEILGENTITMLNLFISTNPTVSGSAGKVELNYWTVTDGAVSFTSVQPELPYMITNNSEYLLSTPNYADQGETVTVTPKTTVYATVTGVAVTDASGAAVAVTESDGKYTFTMPGSAVKIKAESELKFEKSDGIYLLNSADDMKALAAAHVEYYDTTGLSFKLMADVELTTDGGFVPIGTDNTPFKGTFDGDGHTVALNLTKSTFYTGLFGKNNGTIKNVNTTGSVNGTCYVAGIASYSDAGNIVNCTNSAAINGTNTIGGIVGGYANMIMNCYNSGNVTGTDNQVGGIVGFTSNTTVQNCVNSGTVTSSKSSGGIVGEERYNLNNFSCNYYVKDTAALGVGMLNSTALTEDNTSKVKAVEESILFTEDGLNDANLYASENTANGIALYYWVLEDGEIFLKNTSDIVIKFIITNNADYLTVQGLSPSGEDVEIKTDGIPSYMRLTSVKVNDTVVEPDENGKYIFTMPEVHVIVSAEWEINLTKDTDGVYLLNSADDMKTLANAVSGGYDGSGQSFKLTADVSLSTEDGFIPIGTDTNLFEGTFDGGGYTVTLDIKGTDNFAGLFGQNGGTIKNVSTTGSVSGAYYVAGIAAQSLHGTVINCTNSADIYATGGVIGGIIGGYGDAINCYNSGNIEAGVENAGGIIGYAYGSTVENCINSGTVTAGIGCGAIAGYVNDNTDYFSGNCYVTGTADFGVGSIADTAMTEDDTAKTKAVEAAHITVDGLLEHNLYVKENGDGELLYWTVTDGTVAFTSEKPENLPHDINNNSADMLEVAESESAGKTVTVTAKTFDYMTITGVRVETAGGNAVEATANGDGTFTFIMPGSDVYVSAVIEFSEPEMDENGVYLIADEVDLYVFCMMVNNGNGYIDARVTANELDMRNYVLGIGTSEYPYYGRFDGNGALIYTCESLFGVTRNAVIKNINAIMTATQTESGGLVRDAGSTYIDNCKVNAEMGGRLAGGIVSYADSSVITNCEVTASGQIYGFGGIAASTYNTVIANCILNESDISARYYYGGIVGEASDGTRIYNCVNLDYIEAYDAGGIIASTQGDIITENNFYICDEDFNAGLYDVRYNYNENDFYYELKDPNSAVTLDECGKLYIPVMLNSYIKENPDLVSEVTLNSWGAVYDETIGIMVPCFETEDNKVYQISFSNITVASAPYVAVAGDEVSIDFPVDSEVTITDADGDAVSVKDGTFIMPKSPVTIEITMDSGISDTKEIDGKTYVVVKTAEDLIKAVTSIANGNDVLNVYIANDIELSESDLESYPQYMMDSEYNGTFDGGGNTVSFENLSGDSTAMLDVIGEDGIVKNITVAGTIGGSVCAGIALVNNGVIYNCINAADISATNGAGMADENYGVIINCMNSGNISGTYVGAICEYNEKLISICINTGTVISAETGYNTLIYSNPGDTNDNIDFTAESSYMTPAKCAAEMNYSIYYLSKSVEMQGISYAESLNMTLEELNGIISELNKWSAENDEQLVWADDVNKPYYYVTAQYGSIPYQVGSEVEVTFDIRDIEEGFEMYAVTVTDSEDNEIEVTAVEGKEYTYSFTMPDNICKAKMLVAPSALESETGEDGRRYYLVHTLDDLLAAKAAVDIGSTDLNVKLMADIKGYTASPIGRNYYLYNGVFDGNGHSIELNMTDSEETVRYFGLFGMLDTDAVVKNLKTTGTVSTVNANYSGVIAGLNNGMITDCVNEAEITGTRVGGIAGCNESVAEFNVIEVFSVEESGSGIIKNCVNNGKVYGEYVGGITYKTENTIYGTLSPDNSAAIIGCTNNADIYGEGYSGGITVYAHGVDGYNVIIKDCVNNGCVESKTESFSEVGGIITESKYTIVDKCVNNGVVNGYYCGGIVEYVTGNVVIRNCENNGDITATDDGGGIISWVIGGCEIINSMNNGDISAPDAGGIATYAEGGLIIYNCYNSGNVSGDYRYAIACVPDNNGSIVNTYYLNQSDIPSSNLGSDADKSVAVTAKQVESGEVAALLGSAFGQNVDNGEPAQTAPVLGGATVYNYIGGGCSNECFFDFAGISEDKKTVKVNIPTKGTYSVVFVDYNGSRMNDIDVVTFTTKSDNSVVTVEAKDDMTLSAGDKIMFLNGIKNLAPKCDAYIIK